MFSFLTYSPSQALQVCLRFSALLQTIPSSHNIYLFHHNFSFAANTRIGYYYNYTIHYQNVNRMRPGCSPGLHNFSLFYISNAG